MMWGWVVVVEPKTVGNCVMAGKPNSSNNPIVCPGNPAHKKTVIQAKCV